jgi:hypothetical protein
MGALVMDDADFSASVAYQHHGLAADKGAKIVAGLFYLAFVANINPSDTEDALELELEDRRIGIDLPVHAAGLDERREVLGHEGSILVCGLIGTRPMSAFEGQSRHRAELSPCTFLTPKRTR